jgi:hypothetical protein
MNKLPDLIVVHENTFIEYLNRLGYGPTVEQVASAPMHNSTQVQLLVTNGAPEGLSFLRVNRRWYKMDTREAAEKTPQQEAPEVKAERILLRDLTDILTHFAGETGEDEGAVDTLRRLADEVRRSRILLEKAGYAESEEVSSERRDTTESITSTSPATT